MPGGSVNKLLSSVAPTGAMTKPPKRTSNSEFEEILDEIRAEIKDAVDFMFSEFEATWEEAEEYYNGGTSLPKVKGRSNVVKTMVRDAIRNLRPSLLRIFFQTDDIVKYEPSNAAIAPLANQQTKFVNQLYQRQAGYKLLYDVLQDAALRKLGVAKYWHEDEPQPHYYELSNIPEDQYLALTEDEDVTILSEEGTSITMIGPEGPAEIPLYNLELVAVGEKAAIKIEAIPLHEFFISRNAKNLKDSRVYGHRRNMKVGDAVAMGLEYDDWTELDAEDAEFNDAAGSSQERRGYSIQPERDSVDPVMQEVLITEAYARFDLYGIGVPQLWRFWFGGTNYELLHYEHVPDDEPGFALFSIDPEPHTVWGKSIFDLMKQEQDTSTSLLRATCDNAHASNNRRLGVVDSQVNMDDVLNNAINHPIRMRQQGAIQEIGMTSTIGAMLPLLTYLEEDAENKIGVTRASVGLDPDALQSTTKDAVQNTIQLAEGQIEVIARNLAETGLKPLCEGLLRLSIRHMDPEQTIQIEGSFVPVDLSVFQPTLHMRVNVGLGTGQPEKRLLGLQFIYQEQKALIAEMGLGNPIVTPDQLYNTLEDMAKLADIPDISRYFTRLAPEQVQEILAKQEEEAAKQPQPMDPGTAMVEAERIKSDLRAKETRLKSMLDARRDAQKAETDIWSLILQDDQKRDQMEQDLYIKQAEIRGKHGTAVDTATIRALQQRERSTPAAPTGATPASGGQQ